MTLERRSFIVLIEKSDHLSVITLHRPNLNNDRNKIVHSNIEFKGLESNIYKLTLTMMNLFKHHDT